MNKIGLYSAMFLSSTVIGLAGMVLFDNKINNENVSAISVTGNALQQGIQQTDSQLMLRLPPLIFKEQLTQVVVQKKRQAKKPIKVSPASTEEAKVAINSVAVAKAESVKEMPAEKLDLSAMKPVTTDSKDVSDDLLAKFNKALLDTNNTPIEPVKDDTESANAVSINDLPDRLLARVPNINYSSHVYSSNSANRTVRLNSRDLREGSWLTEDIEIVEILQNEVIMRVGPQSFSLKALSDWAG